MALDAAGARRFYDCMGRWQDTQRFYEGAATRRLARASKLAQAKSVFELGCRYLGVDVSPEMVRLASLRLTAWAPRAEVQLLEPPALTLPGADGSFDRFVATYVFDLLSDSDAAALISEAHRLLALGGLLGLVSLTHGTTFASRLVSGGWGAVANRRPGLVGGCRPIALDELIGTGGWRVVHDEVVVSWAVPSEIVVAAREPAR